MTITAISTSRTVPVGEDLTLPETRLNILRGLETMKRVDVKIKSGEALALGEFAVINNSGEAERATGTPVISAYLVFSGDDRFDVAATGQVTLIRNSPIIVETSVFDPAPSYTVGMALNVQDLGGGESFLTEQAGVEPIIARVSDVSKIASGILIYEIVLN